MLTLVAHLDQWSFSIAHIVNQGQSGQNQPMSYTNVLLGYNEAAQPSARSPNLPNSNQQPHLQVNVTVVNGVDQNVPRPRSNSKRRRNEDGTYIVLTMKTTAGLNFGCGKF